MHFLSLQNIINQSVKKNQLIRFIVGYDYGMSYESSGGGSGKEMTLKKVYELALTAIAYLAFGIFILQVIMCITTVCIDIHVEKNPKFVQHENLILIEG